MRNFTEHDITDAVVAGFERCPDPRLQEILTSLVRHLHGFVKESRLTEAEWLEGIEFLTATGRITDERQEFILLSDTLGVTLHFDFVLAAERECSPIAPNTYEGKA